MSNNTLAIIITVSGIVGLVACVILFSRYFSLWLDSEERKGKQR